MAGAVVTMKWGVDGQLSVFEGETAGEIQVRQDMLTLLDRRDQSRAQFELTDGAFGGFASADFADAPSFDKNGLRVEVVRYLPDSAATERIVDDNPRFQPAVAISLSQASPEAMWIFGDEPAALGPVTAALRVARDAAEMQRFLQDEQNADSSSVGKITVTYQGTAREIAVEDCTAQAIKLDGADLSVRVLRYMPHATVGGENGIVNASNEPVNPAVEVELIGAAGTEKRVCFANFPDFQSMHGQEAAPDVKVVFHASQGAKPAAPLEIIVGPERTTFARFNQPGLPSQTQALAVGQPVATPWGGQTLTLHQRFDHARVDRPLEAVEPVRATRIPAVLLRLTSGQNSSEMWVQRGIPRQVSVDGAPYQILYGDRSVPLGFSVTLNDFKIRTIPAGMPRSF
ncbi:MAG: hypothetical protein H6817_04080 [Phycisphaerales bacterium]|nr:hypothetical protein [Phycisphaerales bacterium]